MVASFQLGSIAPCSAIHKPGRMSTVSNGGGVCVDRVGDLSGAPYGSYLTNNYIHFPGLLLLTYQCATNDYRAKVESVRAEFAQS